MNEVLYTTEDLSKMFRVGKSTIKRWTDEGKLQCFKTPGGHRKFRPSNVHKFIQEYRYEVVAPVLPFARTSETISTDAMLVAGDSTIEECLLNAIKGKRQMIEETLSGLYTQQKSLPIIFDSFLTPTLRLIQSKFQQHQISSVEFQIAKNTLIHSLIHFTDTIPKTERSTTEMYCLSVNEGMNEVELKAVELLLENLGMSVYNLGTVLTKYAAQDIVNQCKPEDVFVVLSLDNSSDEIIRQFDALASGVSAYGGNVYTSNFFDEQQPMNKSEKQTKQFHSFAEIAEQFTQLINVG